MTTESVKVSYSLWSDEQNTCEQKREQCKFEATFLIRQLLCWESANLYRSGFPCLPGHFAGEDVKAKLMELHGRWEALKGKAAQRRQDLEDSLQAQQYFADANEAESWMREKEPIVGSTDYGKDEDSAEVSLEVCGVFVLF